jgi:hypothetical protein
LTGVAVYVTDVPEHTGLAEADIVTLTGRLLFTSIVIVFEVAGLSVAQVAFDVITHVTASPFEGV